MSKMNAMPAISVLIPLYNSETFIRDTIDSVLSQTFRDFELLLMDDGSTDSTAEIIRSYRDPRIRYELCPHDFVGTVNRGFDRAWGKYIALLDHDDIMVPRRLQIQFDFMESHPDTVACGGFMWAFGSRSIVWETPLEYPQIILEYIRRIRPAICNPTGFVRRESINKFDIRYRRGYSFAVDSVFWIDVFKIGKVSNLPDVLVWYRTSGSQTSVVALPEAKKVAEVMCHKLIDFLISKIDDSEEIKTLLTDELMPVLKELTDLSCFSSDVYFLLMKEIVEGLYKNGFLNLEEPLGL
jgi:glycosyltransferase involved in cell wall biosynthesis